MHKYIPVHCVKLTHGSVSSGGTVAAVPNLEIFQLPNVGTEDHLNKKRKEEIKSQLTDWLGSYMSTEQPLLVLTSSPGLCQSTGMASLPWKASTCRNALTCLNSKRNVR